MGARFTVCFALAVALAGRASAQDFDAAGRHFAAGQEAFNQKQYARAASEFESAYQITKDPVLLFNVAQSMDRAGDLRQALVRYRMYLAESPQATDRADVEKRIAEIDRQSGVAPASTGANTNASANTEKRDALAPLDEPPQKGSGLLDDSGRPPSRLHSAAWILVATTVAFAVAGGVLGLAANARAEEVSDREIRRGSDGLPLKFDAVTEQQFNDYRNEGRLLNGLAIGFFSGAGALAITSAILFIVDHRRSERMSLRIAPSIDQRQAGLSARWEF